MQRTERRPTGGHLHRLQSHILTHQINRQLVEDSLLGRQVGEQQQVKQTGGSCGA